MTYCDGCYHDDPFECGTFLAGYERARARAARHGGREYSSHTPETLTEAIDRAEAVLAKARGEGSP